MGLDDFKYLIALAWEHPAQAIGMAAAVIVAAYVIAFVREKAKRDANRDTRTALRGAANWLLTYWYIALPCLVIVVGIFWSMLRPPECDQLTMTQEEYDRWGCYNRQQRSQPSSLLRSLFLHNRA